MTELQTAKSKTQNPNGRDRALDPVRRLCPAGRAGAGEATAAGARRFQVDVMDGVFVPNITMGALAVEAVRRSTDAADRSAPDDRRARTAYPGDS